MVLLESTNVLLLILVFFPFVSGFAGYLIGRKSKTARDYFAIAATAAEFFMAVGLCFTSGEFFWNWFAGFGLHFEADGFRMVMAVLCSFLWFMTTVQSREYFSTGARNRNRYYMFMQWTLAATMGVFLSSNLYTTFIFFEIMSFASYVMVIQEENPKAIYASNGYLGYAVFGGLATLMGIFMLQVNLGTLEMDQLLDAAANSGASYATLFVAGLLILVGFGSKASMYPLHTWLPETYLAAPAPATALLSGMLSKGGIFGVLVISANVFLHDYNWGMVVLILGILGMLTGGMLGVLSNNLKRTLAYSSMSQIGFILVGVGMQGVLGEHNALAVHGTVLHIVNHSLVKLVLFMCAGVIFMNLGNFDLNKIRGFGRKKPLFAVIFAMGALTVMGVPAWSGYVSKTLLHESIVEYIAMFPTLTGEAVLFKIIEALFTFAGGLTCAYMIKLFIAVFVEKNTDPTLQAKYDAKKKYMNWMTAACLIIPAAVLPVLGIIPGFTMDEIAGVSQSFLHGHDPAHAVAYFSWTNLKGAVASISIGIILYFLIVRMCLIQPKAAAYTSMLGRSG